MMYNEWYVMSEWCVLKDFARNTILQSNRATYAEAAQSLASLFSFCAESWPLYSLFSGWCSECHADAHHQSWIALLHRSKQPGFWSHSWWTCSKWTSPVMSGLLQGLVPGDLTPGGAGRNGEGQPPWAVLRTVSLGVCLTLPPESSKLCIYMYV